VKQNSFEICKNFYTESEIKQRGPISGARGSIVFRAPQTV